MDLYLKVRLARRGGMSERAAAGHFGISRASVNKMMSFSVPPGYQRTAPIKRPKLDGSTGFIDQWLQDDRSLPRKQRHTAKRIFERLRDEHQFRGGQTTVKNYVREHGTQIAHRAFACIRVGVTSFREDCRHAGLPETSWVELVVAPMVRVLASSE